MRPRARAVMYMDGVLVASVVVRDCQRGERKGKKEKEKKRKGKNPPPKNKEFGLNAADSDFTDVQSPLLPPAPPTPPHPTLTHPIFSLSFFYTRGK